MSSTQLFFCPVSDYYANLLQISLNNKDLLSGRSVHAQIIKQGLRASAFLLNNLLNLYVKCWSTSVAHQVFDEMPTKNTFSWNTIVSGYAKSGQVDLARAQFDQMAERDIVSWNSIVTGYNQRGFHREALKMFSEMLKDSYLKPDQFTLASALSACASLENLNLGKQIHAYMIRTKFDTFGAVENSLITMYSKSGGVENAREIFDSLKDRDVVAWTALIVGYEQNGLNEDAVALFRLMIREGSKPNSYTLAAMLSVSSSLASLDHGKQIHAVALRLQEASSVSVSNALITMYSKAGSIGAARRVFPLHQHRDTVTWTSMIIALAQHGFGEEAIELFEEMLALGNNPDHITYVGVLVACTHVGLVEEGKRYYNMMQKVHEIEPTPSHYSCMVDLFGRAGLLQEAQDFIEKMPIEPDNIAWGSILASCKVHKNLELAKVAAERLLLVDPGNSGAFAALANTYSACGKWTEAAKVRKSMKEKGVKKDQGLSWLQLKNEVHVFGAEDACHPQRDAIYAMMAEIWEEIKKMGFVPDYGSVLHDLDEDVKDHKLRHHSEKLAIAFGLLNTPDNTTLRIMKNLRVCNDCHSAIKYISKLVGREIIVRDATRFHHFKGGVCSCRDYW
ncbi:hypothetical protein RDABS01_016357 [Bienertia sinuspersici]